MKTIKTTILFTLFFLVCLNTEAQILKKLGKRAERAAEEAVIRKTEQKVTIETEKAMDSILNPEIGKKEKKRKEKSSEQDDEMDENNETSEPNDDNNNTNNKVSEQETEPKTFGVYSNFTFVPGNKLLFYDDFEADAIGDFPANWETGGSGEVVTTSDSEIKWLSLIRRSGYMPTLENILPENYTMEFDLTNNGYGPGKPSSKLLFLFMTKKAYSGGSGGTLAEVEILLSNNGFNVRNVSNFGSEVEVKIGSYINREIPDYLNNTVHISIAVNKKRLRMWVNEEKLVDSPNLLQANIGKYFIIEARDVLPEKSHLVGVSNFKIAEAEEDLRSLLLKNGKYSTTGIYFDTGTWVIKNESYGIIKEIATMLKDNPNINIMIVGHTDNVGQEDYNQMLSENRAEAVKQILNEEFGVDENRLQTEGKGETEAENDNSTEKGRANNRRVEFIKI